MKFRDNSDKLLFFLEIEESLNENSEVSSDQESLFIKKRKSELNKLKDFRRSQSAKAGWRRSRYNYMTGIKKFHSSMKGKKFHRQLGNFLSNNVPEDSIFDYGLICNSFNSDESLDKFCNTDIQYNLDYSEILNLLKSLSSLKTHLLIESEYFYPLFEDFSLKCFMEDLLYFNNLLNEKLLNINIVLPISCLEFLVRTSNNSYLIPLSEKCNRTIEEVKNIENSYYQSFKKYLSEDADGFYSLVYLQTMKQCCR